MKLSASQAAKQVGKSTQTITRAIKSGRMSAEKLDSGGYAIEPVELFRVYPKVANDTDATPQMEVSGTPNDTSVLEKEIELLREQLADVRSDRDQWREQASKITHLLEDNSEKSAGFFARIFKQS